MLGYVLSHLTNYQLLPFMTAAVAARTEINHSLAGDRELLYLDLALERLVRWVGWGWKLRGSCMEAGG